MFCRNCGKGLDGTPDICSYCGSHPVKATAFCRYCGNATTAQDLACPKCGSAIQKIAGAKREPKHHAVLTALNITAIALVVSLYIWLSLPPKVAKPIKVAASDVVMATTGYNSLPLHSISVFPTTIPRLNDAPGNAVIFTVNTTQQITTYAIYKNITADNTTKATRFEEVTSNATYKSSNDKIVIVTSGGLAQGVAHGSANITIFYTAVPGSANLSAASAGKVPITVTTRIPVTVR